MYLVNLKKNSLEKFVEIPNFEMEEQFGEFWNLILKQKPEERYQRNE